MIYLWFLRKVSAFLSYLLELSFDYGKYKLYQKLYCWRLKIDRLLVKLVLNKHFRELKK